MKKFSIVVALFFLLSAWAGGQTLRQEVDLAGLPWQVWMDTVAPWMRDTLYLPSEVDLNKIPVKAPTCGWNELYRSGVESNIPVCVEELFSQGNSAWTYHGVSWFSTQLDVPKDWNGKTVRLFVAKKNLRLEVYVNEKLAGYDLVAGTPYWCNVTPFLKPGTKNRIALRITNPGGLRGWNDFPLISWGSYKLPPGRDFGGIGGEVKLVASGDVFIDDLFVKNLQPAKANNIEVNTRIVNLPRNKVPAKLKIKVTTADFKKTLFEQKIDVSIVGLPEQLFTHSFSVPGAALWDVENPNLYRCEVTLEMGQAIDSYSTIFGFRVFEVRANEQGEQNYYLNGKRFRHKSAIDWGYYAHHGYYPSPEMARQSVLAAKQIGHNGINCHRNMGDPLLFQCADQQGLLIFEEPGGFDETIKLYKEVGTLCVKTFEGQLMYQRCMRMAHRDRNHPSVVGYIMANERDVFDLLRKNTMLDMHALDNSKLIVNQSGGVPGGPSGQVPHLRPYDSKFRLDYMDDHTVNSDSRFMEYEFKSHLSANDTAKHGIYGRINPLESDNIIYWGEVRCYAGPDNWYKVAKQGRQLPQGRTGYDMVAFMPLADKIEAFFKNNNLAKTGSRIIQSPSKVTEQAGRGLMYINGRLEQVIMSNNSADGFAINGWSGGSSGIPKEHGDIMEWYSAIVDEGRNLKGPAADYCHWNKPLQVAIFRKNGKYFEPGDDMAFSISLINEGILKPGEYKLVLKVKDGDGNQVGLVDSCQVAVDGRDTFAQTLYGHYTVKADAKWKAGYITLYAELTQNGKMVAGGSEQVLLKNRASYKNEMAGAKVGVYGWDAAELALQQAGCTLSTTDAGVLLAGEKVSGSDVENLLQKARRGATLMIKFEHQWAEALFAKGVLKEKVTQWGGRQIPYWNGNGWGYIDHLVGNQAIPSVATIGTNSWEVPGDPIGFYPFEANYPQTAYGAWFARPNTLLVLFGEINYGKGRILLAPSYPVDEGHAFNDLLFYNMVKHAIAPR